MSTFSGHDLICFRGERTVFAGLDFALMPGAVLVLRGANGSGKSSLLRLMAGLGRPLSGRIAWDDTAIHDDREAHGRRAHFIGHADPVKAVLTVSENLNFWARLRGLDAKAAGPAVARALERLAIPHLGPVPGRYLSAGQRRRVNLARLGLAPAPLWLLDEPATALDRDAGARLDDLIANHRAQGGMVVLSTHADDAPEGAGTLDLARFQAPEAAS